MVVKKPKNTRDDASSWKQSLRREQGLRKIICLQRQLLPPCQHSSPQALGPGTTVTQRSHLGAPPHPIFGHEPHQGAGLPWTTARPAAEPSHSQARGPGCVSDPAAPSGHHSPSIRGLPWHRRSRGEERGVGSSTALSLRQPPSHGPPGVPSGRHAADGTSVQAPAAPLSPYPSSCWNERSGVGGSCLEVTLPSPPPAQGDAR